MYGLSKFRIPDSGVKPDSSYAGQSVFSLCEESRKNGVSFLTFCIVKKMKE
jgi:hypothetical protein